MFDFVGIALLLGVVFFMLPTLALLKNVWVYMKQTRGK